MGVATLEEHFSFAAITDRIDKAVIAERSFVLGSTRPGTNPVPRLEDVGEGRPKSMDENGISVQVLSVTRPGAELWHRLPRDYNDAIFAKAEAHPTRFAAFAHLPMTTPQSAADELERAVKPRLLPPFDQWNGERPLPRRQPIRPHFGAGGAAGGPDLVAPGSSA